MQILIDGGHQGVVTLPMCHPLETRNVHPTANVRLDQLLKAIMLIRHQERRLEDLLEVVLAPKKVVVAPTPAM